MLRSASLHARARTQPWPPGVLAARDPAGMPELRQCRTCAHDYIASVGGRHDCARFKGALKVRDPAAPWIRMQVFGELGLPRPDADGCPGWRGWADEGAGPTAGAG